MTLKEKASQIASRLSHKYRVMVVDNESLGTSRSWLVRPWGMILLFLGFATLVGGVTLLVAGATHFKGGGGSAIDQAEYNQMVVQLDSVKKQLDEQNAYIESFRRGTGIDLGPVDSNAVANLSDGGINHYGHASEIPEQAPPSQGSEAGHSEAGHPNSLSGILAQPRSNIATLNLIPPVDGMVTQGYDHVGANEQHYGIDLVADENSIIRSVADGVVIFSEYSGQTGYVIAVMHPQYNLVSFYKHNSRVFKSTGSYVFAGEAIAVIGNSGKNQSGTHLHFELWYNGNPINPQDYILF